MLESAYDQWRIPVMRGNFDSSCALAGAWPESLESGIDSEESFASIAAFAGAGVAAAASFGDAEVGGFTGMDSVRIIALLS